VTLLSPGLASTPTSPTRRPDTRRWLAAGAAAAVVIVAVIVVLVVGGGSSTTQPIAPVPLPHPGPGPASMFTPASQLTTAPAATIDTLAALGVDQVHVYLHWADIAPDPNSRRRPVFDAADPAAYPAANWAVFDTVVRDLKARHIAIDLALVPPPPLWAEGKGAPNPGEHPYWRPSTAEWGQFVEAVGLRYSGHYIPPGATAPLPRVDFWSIWNEPNLGIELAPQAVPHTRIEVSGTLYRQIVDAAWRAFAATGHGHDTILIGETAPAGATFGDAPGLFAVMSPLRFLRALYCVDAGYAPLRGLAARQRGCPATAAGSATFAADNPGLFHASGYANHPYPQGLAPNEPTPGQPDFAELAATGNLERTLDRLQQVYGSHTRFPIWSTEFGYQTTPPDTESGVVSPTRAAYYLNWSEYLTWLDPRQRSYDQYLLDDPPDGNFASGLETATGLPKPGFYAFRMPLYLPYTATRSGHPLAVWGCVRPAPNAARATHRTQVVAIEFQPGGGGAFRTVERVPITDRHGYFDVPVTFPGSGNVRLAWTYPRGPQIFSRTVVVALR